eukprot:378462-Rhodomonas_salina.1
MPTCSFPGAQGRSDPAPSTHPRHPRPIKQRRAVSMLFFMSCAQSGVDVGSLVVEGRRSREDTEHGKKEGRNEREGGS